MPTREQTIFDAIRIYQNAKYPDKPNPLNAWLGIYQTLLWYEPINWLGYTNLPHIIDADKLRPSSPTKKRTWVSPNIWQRRGQAISLYLAERLGCSIESLPEMTDLLMKQPDYEGMQRQNTLGIAFMGLVEYILRQYGSAEVLYKTEVEASSIFPGITFPGRSGTPRIDLLANRNGIPCAILSAKWSLRHDRVSDLTNECPVYKAAYQRIFRNARSDRLLYYVVTNEYDPARLNKVIEDSCIDGVVHTHKAAVVDVCELNGRLARLLDLSELIDITKSW